MIVTIDNDYLIEIDQFNYTLKRKSVVEKGKTAGEDKLVTCGYFPDMTSAIKRYVNLVCIDNIEEVKLFDLISAINLLFNDIVATITEKVK